LLGFRGLQAGGQNTQTDGTDTESDGKRRELSVDFVPFFNMNYTSAAFDYLIYYRLQEAINPGFLERMEPHDARQARHRVLAETESVCPLMPSS
jgi:hypothetical protein